MNEAPAFVPHARQPTRWPLMVAGAVGVIFIAGIALLYTFHTPTRLIAQLAWVSATLPSELRGVHALSHVMGQGVLYRFDTFRYTRTGTAGGRIIAASPGTPDPIFIQGEQGFTVSSGDRLYYASSSAIAPASSPSGKLMTFSRVTTGGVFNPDPGTWEVVLIHRESGDTTALSGGTASAFLSDTRIAQITSTGLFAFDLVTGVPVKLLEAPIATPVTRLEQSPDRSLLAWIDPTLVSTVVYRVNDISLEKVAVLPSMQSSMLGNSALYELRVLSDGSADVWRYELATGSIGKKIYTFPKELSITELYL